VVGPVGHVFIAVDAHGAILVGRFVPLVLRPVDPRLIFRSIDPRRLVRRFAPI